MGQSNPVFEAAVARSAGFAWAERTAQQEAENEARAMAGWTPSCSCGQPAVSPFGCEEATARWTADAEAPVRERRGKRRQDAAKSERNVQTMPAVALGPVVDMASRMSSWTDGERLADPEAVRSLVAGVVSGRVGGVWPETREAVTKVARDAEALNAFVAEVAAESAAMEAEWQALRSK